MGTDLKKEIKRTCTYLRFCKELEMVSGKLITLGCGVINENGKREYMLGDDGLYLGNEDKTLEKVATIEELLEMIDDES